MNETSSNINNIAVVGHGGLGDELTRAFTEYLARMHEVEAGLLYTYMKQLVYAGFEEEEADKLLDDAIKSGVVWLGSYVQGLVMGKHMEKSQKDLDRHLSEWKKVHQSFEIMNLQSLFGQTSVISDGLMLPELLGEELMTRAIPHIHSIIEKDVKPWKKKYHWQK
jgi:hypothetical protein